MREMPSLVPLSESRELMSVRLVPVETAQPGKVFCQLVWLGCGCFFDMAGTDIHRGVWTKLPTIR